jgi:uncharacterized membrane protein YeiH
MGTLFSMVDLAGTFVFAISGASAGVRRQLDLFGVLVLSFAAATFGGVTRDLVIGAAPPAAIADWHYAVASLLAGIITFYGYNFVERLKSPVLVFDAAGLALFAVAGTEKALVYGLHPVPAALLGMLSGIGGGIARDMLLTEIPIVLRAELYAVAALAGATIVALSEYLHLSSDVAMVTGAAVCFGLRLVAVRRGWRLPIAKQPETAGSQTSDG